MALRLVAATANTSAWTLYTSALNNAIHATTNISLGTGTNLGAQWTAPNTTNAVVGAAIFASAVSSGTITVSLLQSGVSVASTTINVSDLYLNDFTYVEFGTPFVYTTLTANAYRIQVQASVTGNSIAANAGGAVIATFPFDNRTGALGATDDIYQFARKTGAGASTAVNVTQDGDLSFGAGADTTTVTSARANNSKWALYIGQGCKWTIDTSASRTNTVLGSVGINGELEIGTAASPVPAANTITWNMNQNGTAVNYGFWFGPASKRVIQGTPKKSTSAWFANMVSGTGVTATPVVLSADIGSVGDELVFHATAATGQTEYRFITAKPTATSYVLSLTSGGADAALTNTHSTNCEVVNLSRNVIFKTTNTSHGVYALNYSERTDNDIDWMRWETVGGGIAAKAMSFGNSVTAMSSSHYIVVYRVLGTTSGFTTVSSEPNNFTGLTIVRATSTGSMMNLNTTTAQTFNHGFLLGSSGSGITLNGAATIRLNDVRIIDNTSVAVVSTFNANIEFVGGSIQGNGTSQAIFFGSSFASTGTHTFTNTKIGSYLANSAGNIGIASGKYADVLFDNCLFDDTSPTVTGLTDAAQATEFRFHRFNQTVNKHYWLTSTSSNQSTGAGLSDTTLHTNPNIDDNLNVRLAPIETSVGGIWEYLIPARVNQFASSAGGIKLNAAFTGDSDASCMVELFLPGSTIADYSQTMSKSTNDWQVFQVFANYTGTEDRFATVRITAKSDASNAYAYVADIDNGTNTITALKTWYQGKPSKIMFPQLGDAAAVWAVATSTLTTSGTTGKKLVDDLTTGKFIALK